MDIKLSNEELDKLAELIAKKLAPRLARLSQPATDEEQEPPPRRGPIVHRSRYMTREGY